MGSVMGTIPSPETIKQEEIFEWIAIYMLL